MIYNFQSRHCHAEQTPRVPVLSNEEAWSRLPKATVGTGQQLPTWARMLVAEMPRTTAACLQLDYAHRGASPIPAKLRAAMRWVAGNANRCACSQAQALSDAKAAGVSDALLSALTDGTWSGWNEADQQALKFARDMTVDSDSVSDEQFSALVRHFDERRTACMVLLMAYANFQDRLLLSLGVPLESEGSLSPLDARFPAETFVFRTTPPPANAILPLQKDVLVAAGPISLAADNEWNKQNYDFLQERLKGQTEKPTRLKILPWDQIAPNLPKGLMKGPSEIVWYQIVFGYAPELAVPFELVMRTAGFEASGKWDRIFGSGLFWVTTKSVACPYCMGHCEMNWEVAGLNRQQIADRSRLLSDSDWSSFPVAEQHAYAFARKLSRVPWEIKDEDVQQLQHDFGADRALIVMFNASRYHYMTRISNGFQLTLEKENVFYDYYNVKSPVASVVADRMDASAVAILSDAECWDRLPETVSGTGQPLPSWARAIAIHLPRTAAAMLKLDFAHRTMSPVDPVLRAKMRWVIADANHSEYSKAYAIADLKRAGAGDDVIRILTGDHKAWPETDRQPLEFARLLTVAAPTILDSMFEELRQKFGDNQVASMVLLAAYGNFQDRIVLGLNLQMEENGPLPPLDVEFAAGALQIASLIPPHSEMPTLHAAGEDVVPDEVDWASISFDELQARLEKQRAFAYTRKLSKTPWTLTPEDYRSLENDLGPAKAMSTFWWLCRGLYMTRISDGFQLPLERQNVFGDAPKK